MAQKKQHTFIHKGETVSFDSISKEYDKELEGVWKTAFRRGYWSRNDDF